MGTIAWKILIETLSFQPKVNTMMKHFGGMLLLLLTQPVMAERSLQENLFFHTASSLVACYEKVGFLQNTYDEEGRCTESGELSAWTMQAESPLDAELEQFQALGRSVVGAYEGRVIFRNALGSLCFFSLDFLYSGEDITVNVSKFACVGAG